MIDFYIHDFDFYLSMRSDTTNYILLYHITSFYIRDFDFYPPMCSDIRSHLFLYYMNYIKHIMPCQYMKNKWQNPAGTLEYLPPKKIKIFISKYVKSFRNSQGTL